VADNNSHTIGGFR